MVTNERRRIVPDLRRRQHLGAGHVWLRPSIALDTNERAHVAVMQVLCNECGPEGQRWDLGIFYLTDARETPGEFSRPQRLTGSGLGPSIAVGRGHLMIAYQSHGGDVRLMTKDDGVWRSRLVARDAGSPALAISAGGKPRIAFADDRGIGFARPRVGSSKWRIEHVVGTSRGDGRPVLTLDSNGRAWIAFMTGNTWVAPIALTRRGAERWSVPTRVHRGSSHDLILASDRWPQVLIGGRDALGLFQRDGDRFVGIRVFGAGVADGGGAASIGRAPDGRLIAAWVGASGDPGWGLWLARSLF